MASSVIGGNKGGNKGGRGRAPTEAVSPGEASDVSLFDLSYDMPSVMRSYQSAMNLLRREGYPSGTPSQCKWLAHEAFAYAIFEEDDGLRNQVRGQLDNQALVTALFLTITLPTFISPPAFAQLGASVWFEDSLVRAWFYLGALAVLSQGILIMTSMVFRVFVLDNCVSDLHFLPLYLRSKANPVSGAVLQTIVLFIVSLLSTTAWFVLSGFLMYEPDDARVLVAGAFVGAAFVVFSWLPSLVAMNNLKKGIVTGFIDKYCDESCNIRQAAASASAAVVAQGGVEGALNPVHQSGSSTA